MISVKEATDIIHSIKRNFQIIDIPLEKAIGHVLREPLSADRDFPPYDRVSMDGIAFKYDADRAEDHRFLIENTQHAGEPKTVLSSAAHCVEIMTGAVCPEGADMVARYEDLEILEKNGKRYAQLTVPYARQWANVHRQGLDRKKGDVLMQAGRLIGGAETAVAATIGASQIRASKPARVAVISSGDELVQISETPLPHQIRRSNGQMIAACLAPLHCQTDVLHLPDNEKIITQKLTKWVDEYDLIILSGGVSMGKADFIPAALRASGVNQLFHKVQQRPGKPLWFGEKQNGAVVFALPGNPVSSFVGTQRYVLPWLKSNLGLAAQPPLYARLAADLDFRPPLTYFLQVSLYSSKNGELWAKITEGKGSGDLANLLQNDALMELPPDQNHFKAGSVFPVWRF